MQRRRMLQSLAAVPAASVVPLPAFAQAAAPAPVSDDPGQLAVTPGDAVGEPVHRFLNAAQFAALERLAEVVVPALNSRPGAKEAGAPAFLDFLLSQSPADRQSLYVNGLNALNQRAQRTHDRPFAALSALQVDPLVAPLREAWSYDGPADPFAKFLQAAKADLVLATLNSREYSTAMSARSRSAGGTGTYWLPIE